MNMMNGRTGDGIVFFCPTREWVQNLRVGDKAPNCFGEWREVREITYSGIDINGKAFVGYYTEFGPGSTISHSATEGEIDRTVPLTNRYTSHEIDALERSIA